jgi:TonB family protein
MSQPAQIGESSPRQCSILTPSVPEPDHDQQSGWRFCGERTAPHSETRGGNCAESFHRIARSKIRFDLARCDVRAAFALALLMTSAPAPLQRGGRAESPRPCAAGAPCCPSALVGFCRVGCPGPAPVPLRRVTPNIETLRQQHPNGIAILELGISEEGRVVSACVLRGVRSDFDKAAQAAALKWLWTPTAVKGKPVGVVVTVTFRHSRRAQRCRRAYRFFSCSQTVMTGTWDTAADADGSGIGMSQRRSRSSSLDRLASSRFQSPTSGRRGSVHRVTEACQSPSTSSTITVLT